MSKRHTATIAEATKAIEGNDLLHKYYWFNHMRLNLVRHVLSKYLQTDQSLLDFGCGKGIQLAQLKKSHPSINYAGYEPYMTSAQVDNSIPLFRDLHELGGKSFNFITALDVIEHIKDDLQALQDIHRLLTADGRLIINVPAFMHLWCPMDSIHGHYRRYTKHSLTTVVKKAGFKVVEVFYIFPYVWPVFILRQYAYKILALLGIDYDENTVMRYFPIDPLKIPSRLVALELALIKKTRYRSPFGTSLFLYATKMS